MKQHGLVAKEWTQILKVLLKFYFSFAFNQQVLSIVISLEPEQITDLAEKITLAIETLTNINAIIDATRNDLDLAIQLKGTPDYVSF